MLDEYFDKKLEIKYFENKVMNENTFFEKLRCIICKGCSFSVFYTEEDEDGNIIFRGDCRANLNNLIVCLENDYNEYQNYIDEVL